MVEVGEDGIDGCDRREWWDGRVCGGSGLVGGMCGRGWSGGVRELWMK